MRKFEVEDYNGYLAGEDRLGIYFYGEWVYEPWKQVAKLGIRSYEFKLRLITSRIYSREPMEFEPITFLYTTDFADVPLREFKFEKHSFKLIDWDTYLQKIAPKEFRKAAVRLRRKRTRKIPEPVVYTAGDWHKNDEFLVFTKESAGNWGGPYEQNGKLGCCASISTKENYAMEYPLFEEVEKNWHGYNVPGIHGEGYGEFANKIYSMTPEQRVEAFKTYDLKTQIAIAEDYIKHLHGAEYGGIREKLPVRLYLCGNDDCSYSKWFQDEEEAQTELQYLRKMQPLDFYLDIVKRDYSFTN